MKNNKKYLVCGDLHGDYDLMKKIVQRFSPEYYLIFLGDLLDSFVFSPRQQIECVKLMLTLIKQGTVACCMGNHEASYLFPKTQLASGWNQETDRLLEPYKQEIVEHFNSVIWFEKEKILISHAGLTKPLWDHYKITVESLSKFIDQWFQNLKSPYYFIGRSRGGYDPVGGLLWCDWRHEFQSIPEIKQIVGHTPLKKYDCRGNDWNIDVLQNKEKVVLQIDPGMIMKITL